MRLAHGVEVEPLRQAFDRVIGDLDADELDDLDKAKVRVAGQDVFGVEVWFALPCADPNTSWDMACLAREKLMAECAKLQERTGDRVFPEVQPAEAA